MDLIQIVCRANFHKFSFRLTFISKLNFPAYLGNNDDDNDNDNGNDDDDDDGDSDADDNPIYLFTINLYLPRL